MRASLRAYIRARRARGGAAAADFDSSSAWGWPHRPANHARFRHSTRSTKAASSGPWRAAAAMFSRSSA